MSRLRQEALPSAESFGGDGTAGPAARIVVLGHQRSGTSAVAHLLAAAAGARLVDDPPWAYTANVERVYGDDAATTAFLEEHRGDFEIGILKAPALTLVAPFIERWQPSLRFVFVVRNPRDTIAAVLEWRRHRDGGAATDFWDLRWMGIEEEDRVQALARRWLRFLEAAEQLTRVTWFSYDRFCGDQTAAVNRLMQELCLERHASIAALANQQFKKDFGDRRIRGKNRWQTELSSEEAQQIDALCEVTWRRLARRLL